jgi:hypothetical protein
MNRTVTLELSETMIAWLETSAHERGMSPADWIVFTLTEQYRLQHNIGSSQGPTLAASPLAPTQCPGNGRANDAEADEARERFRSHFGRMNSADPHSADNERIDDDLARAYSELPKDEV